MESPFVIGSKINKITTIGTIKGIMIDLFKGYPAYIYWGIIEGRFKNGQGDVVRDKLEQDGFIEIENDKHGRKCYRLTNKGVDFAMSLINIEHNEKITKLTWWIIGLTIAMLIGGGFQIGTSLIPYLIN